MRAAVSRNKAVKERSASDCQTSPGHAREAPHEGHPEHVVGTTSPGFTFVSNGSRKGSPCRIHGRRHVSRPTFSCWGCSK